jgi:hypothetical protein
MRCADRGHARRCRRLEVAADGLAPHGDGLLDAPQRPAEPSECEDLLLLGVVQDVAHAGDRTCVQSRRQRLDRYREGRFSTVDQWPVLGVHRGTIV